MSWTLLIMAAGLGSRFGGDKQLVAVGPDGETFFDFAIRDAKAAGATDVVLIVRSEIEADVAAHLRRVHGDEPFTFVRQDVHGPARTKPWGTAHAILTAADAIDGPFIVVNADDYYGPSSYALGADALGAAGDDEGVLIGFELGRTLPRSGSVSRGVVHAEDGRLVGIVETHGIERRPDGVIVSDDPPGELAADTTVSMNMFGLRPRFLDHLRARWPAWLEAHCDEEKTEFLLPTVIAELMAEGELTMTLVRSTEDWIGVTNPDDLGPAREALARR